MKVTFIGGAHMDHMGKLTGETVLGASNPGKLTTMPGGAGLNSARVAAMLGSKVTLAGPIGDDAQAKTIRDLLGEYAIGDSLVTVPGGRTGSYTSIIAADGSVVVALADLALNENMDYGWLMENCSNALVSADMWFLTSNVSRTTIDVLAQNATRPIAATTVSVSKAIRLRGVLDKLEILFTNQAEAQSLLFSKETDCVELAKQLMAKGIARGVVSNAGNPLGLWHNGVATELEVPQVSAIADVTGAGDALAGTVIAAIGRGDDFETAVGLGVKAGVQTIQVLTPVDEQMSWEKLA